MCQVMKGMGRGWSIHVLLWSLLARSVFRPLCIVAKLGGRGGTCIKELKVNVACKSPWGWTRTHQSELRGWYCLTSPSETWSKRQGASLARLQATPTQEKWLICWRASLLAKSEPTGISSSPAEMNARSLTQHRNRYRGAESPDRHYIQHASRTCLL